MRTLKEIQKILTVHKEELCRKYKIKEIGVFGSYVRGEQTEKSDVDIIVDFYELPDIFDLLRLERSLCRLLRCKVDVVRKQAIRKELRDRVLSEVINL
ncbi:MAG: nucleotidyltransferase family protein [Candidatus Thermoplasmatota archaeon]